jgi:DNA-binding transcriptional regulator YiaG
VKLARLLPCRRNKEDKTLTPALNHWYNRVVTPKELRKWRENNGYLQSELAAILGVALMSVSRWETGTRSIPSFLHLALKAIPKKDAKKGGGCKY